MSFGQQIPELGQRWLLAILLFGVLQFTLVQAWTHLDESANLVCRCCACCALLLQDC